MYTCYANGKKTGRKLCLIFQKRITQKLSTFQREYRETDPCHYPLSLDNITRIWKKLYCQYQGKLHVYKTSPKFSPNIKIYKLILMLS